MFCKIMLSFCSCSVLYGFEYSDCLSCNVLSFSKKNKEILLREFSPSGHHCKPCWLSVDLCMALSIRFLNTKMSSQYKNMDLKENHETLSLSKF